MKCFIELKINPDAEMRENVLLNKVITKLHKALCDLKSTDIGVSFPQVGKKLGQVVRLHGAQEKLQELQNLNWLGGLSGYCHISEIRQIPDKVQYRNVSRVQSKMTPAKLRRLIKRGSISDEEVKAYKVKMFSQRLDYPYLELKSGSNNHLHRRYIKHGS